MPNHDAQPTTWFKALQAPHTPSPSALSALHVSLTIVAHSGPGTSNPYKNNAAPTKSPNANRLAQYGPGGSNDLLKVPPASLTGEPPEAYHFGYVNTAMSSIALLPLDMWIC